MKRFEVAVLSVTSQWTDGGPLTPLHVALILPTVPSDFSSVVQKAADTYSFVDPWSGSGVVSLTAHVIVLNLGGFASLDDALAEAAVRLQEIDQGNPTPVRRNFAGICDPE